MATETGSETIAERRARLQVELDSLRTAIKRMQDNGAAFTVHGETVTEVGFINATRREKDLEAQIAQLNRRLAGVKNKSRIARLA